MPTLPSSRVRYSLSFVDMDLAVSSWALNAINVAVTGTDMDVCTESTHANTTTTEVDRALENLAKSGKPFGPGFPPTPMGNARRESMPMMGGGPRPYPDYGTQPRILTPVHTDTPLEQQQRMGGPQRHHSVSEYDGSRSHSASNVQGFYQNQRYAPRPNDADQMAQAKRRMAAQRERELRNYHQEQQYHRSKDSESGQQ